MGSKDRHRDYFDSLGSRNIGSIMARDHVLHGALPYLPCADLHLENLRIARHIVQRGVLAGGEEAFTYHAPKTDYFNPDYPTPKVRRGAEMLPHACDDCMHNGETMHQGVAVRMRGGQL